MADPSVIRDQRQMVGWPRVHETVEQVEKAWEDWSWERGFPYRQRLGDDSRDLRESKEAVQAYVSGGKWIADCPRCNGGIACWRENPRGACLDCGTIYRVAFPSKAKEARAVELLALRPDPGTRTWLVHEGETVEDLEAENERHLGEAKEEQPPTGAVALDEVLRVLGRRAYEKLQAEGVV